MNKYAKWFRWVLKLSNWLLIILGALMVFLPNTVLRTLGLDPSHDVLWTAAFGMGLLAIGMLAMPAARDPYRYSQLATFAVVEKALFALFFLVIWPGRYVLFGILDLVLFLILFVLLWLARKQPQPEWQPTYSAT